MRIRIEHRVIRRLCSLLSGPSTLKKATRYELGNCSGDYEVAVATVAVVARREEGNRPSDPIAPTHGPSTLKKATRYELGNCSGDYEVAVATVAVVARREEGNRPSDPIAPTQ
nr:hypothetical transcript [Hymenolepis microstoma]